MQEDDDFVLEYMNWLGHHEFGLNQKAFQFGEETPQFSENKASLDYWLQIWINYYSYLLTVDRKNVIFVDYDYYCIHPAELIQSIYQKAGIKGSMPELTPYQNKRKAELECSAELKSKAEEIFQELKSLSPKA